MNLAPVYWCWFTTPIDLNGENRVYVLFSEVAAGKAATIGAKPLHWPSAANKGRSGELKSKQHSRCC